MSRQVEALNKKIDQVLKIGTPTPTPSASAQIQTQVDVCALCSLPSHTIPECPLAPQYPDLVQEYVNNFQTFGRQPRYPSSNTYNPGFRNHPNLSWRNPDTYLAPVGPHNQNFQTNFRAPNQQVTESQNPQYQNSTPPASQRNISFEDKVLGALSTISTGIQNDRQLLHSHSQSISKLESQIGQIAMTINRRDEGRLPSQPIANPKGVNSIDENQPLGNHHEQVKSITTLRSGKAVDNRVEMPVGNPEPISQTDQSVRPLAAEPA